MKSPKEGCRKAALYSCEMDRMDCFCESERFEGYNAGQAQTPGVSGDYMFRNAYRAVSRILVQKEKVLYDTNARKKKEVER